MLIRPAELKDCEGLARVHVDSWRVTYRGYMPDSVLDELSYAERTERWKSNLERPRAETFVAVDERGGVTGFAGLGPCRDGDAPPATGEVYAIYVAPSRARRGIGTALMDRLVERATQPDLDYQQLWLWAGDQNHGAMAFYRRHGFVSDGQEKFESHLTGTPLRHLRFTRALAALR